MIVTEKKGIFEKLERMCLPQDLVTHGLGLVWVVWVVDKIPLFVEADSEGRLEIHEHGTHINLSMHHVVVGVMMLRHIGMQKIKKKKRSIEKERGGGGECE